jgi:hypothetical protein
MQQAHPHNDIQIIQVTGFTGTAIILLLLYITIPFTLAFVLLSSILISALWWLLTHLVENPWMATVIDYIAIYCITSCSSSRPYFDTMVRSFLQFTGAVGMALESWMVTFLNIMLDDNDVFVQETTDDTCDNVGGLIPKAPPIHQYTNTPRYHPVSVIRAIQSMPVTRATNPVSSTSDWELL